ncbi:UNVERIFIED_CONTAM: RHOMBOID-like protein 12, mitochondrial [Sesamum radiatum]|uniref:RHOMBOID-like protein 12, mitochondrial n=1 Tax=Sesamum radiatum TaxID=300843 RepID=A0AAW2RX20_SESRA
MGIDPSKVPGLGASGAVNAIMLLNIFLHPSATLYFNFFIPVPAILLGIFIIGKDVLRILEVCALGNLCFSLCYRTIELHCHSYDESSDIANLMGDHEVSGSAHLGGATVAALAWAQSRRGRFRRF